MGGAVSESVGARHPVLAAAPHPLVAQPGGDLVDPLHVRRVQVAVVLVMRVDVQPAHRRDFVVVRVEVEVGAELGVAVEVERGGLHPRVVRVARVVDVAAVDYLPHDEELIDHFAELAPLVLVLDGAHLLRKLAAHLVRVRVRVRLRASPGHPNPNDRRRPHG